MNLFSVGCQPSVNFRNTVQNNKAKNNLMSFPLAQDTFVKSSNNLSFCGKYGDYDFKLISKEELAKKREEVKKKAQDMGIEFGFADLCIIDRDSANIPIQALNVLLDHEICKNPSVVSDLFKITFEIEHFGSAPAAKAMLEFADFITSDEMKDVYGNESIYDNMGNIISSCSKDNLKYKKDMAKFLANNKEILSKDINLGDYLYKLQPGNYDKFIEELSKTEPKYEAPTAEFNRQSVSEITPTQETKTTGRVMTKKEGELSGFARIGGQAQAISLLKKSVIWPKKFPGLYKGRSLEKGAILYGPPGTGKSLMATAFAEEYGAYCVKIGASEMSEKWVGASEENWRKLFDELRAHQPALLFIDEMDALCKKRGGGDVHGDKELNQFLKLVSDIKAENLDVFILGATNNYEALDPAVTRDGRFGLHIEMLPPKDVEAVGEIFDIHTRELPLDRDVEEKRPEIFKKILELGLTGAGIEALISDAHDEALSRLGLFEKMENDTVTQSDCDNFSIKAQDILKVIENKKRTTENADSKGKIGFAP